MKNTYTLIAVDRKRRARRRNVQKFFKGFEEVLVLQLFFIVVIGLSVLLHLQAVGF